MLLQIESALDRVDGAGELDQHAVAHQLYETAAMFRQQWLDDGLVPERQGSERAGLVDLDQPAVADHIGGQNGGETTMDARFDHIRRLPSKVVLGRTLCSRKTGFYRPGLPVRVIRYGGDPAASPAMSAVTPIADQIPHRSETTLSANRGPPSYLGFPCG